MQFRKTIRIGVSQMESVLVGIIIMMLSFMVLIAILAFVICAVMCMKRVADMTIELFEREKRIRELEAEVKMYQNKERA